MIAKSIYVKHIFEPFFHILIIGVLCVVILSNFGTNNYILKVLILWGYS